MVDDRELLGIVLERQSEKSDVFRRIEGRMPFMPKSMGRVSPQFLVV
jgi:hypothetical protein